MMQRERRSRPPKIRHLLDLLQTEFDDALPAYELFEELLRRRSYSRSFALKLIDAARGDGGIATVWETRCLAVLLLENLLLRLSPARIDEWDFILTRLKLKTADAVNLKVRDSVLKEGYSTTRLRGFVAGLRLRLARLKRVHDKIGGSRTPRSALRDFLHVSRRESKLTLARYLFRPAEVAARILRQVKTSTGLPDVNPFQHACVGEETKRALSRLPDFEAAIIKILSEHSRIFWVAEETGAGINSLVEYPLTSVVLVLKLPGSDIEFEIKRAGLRGVHPLNVIYRRRGDAVPPSHRLDGGSMQEGLRYEVNSASRLSRVFRAVHEAEAPIPGYLSRASIYNVPARGGAQEAEDVSILDYFTDPKIFGAGFSHMRTALEESVNAFDRENWSNLPELPGSLGLTMRFLSDTTPSQAILSGTTSFRLDKLAAYLSGDGDKTYFTEGLKVEYTKTEAKQFANELLEEVLCVYTPPAVAYRSHEQYLRAAFRVAANRRMADLNYLSVLEQIGTFWGTLFAIRGHSLGESFVPRNVGLRSVWHKGQWRIRIIFMDHDNLQTNEMTPADFQAVGILKSLSADDVYIWGERADGRFANSETYCLETIYRVRPDTVADGRTLFDVATQKAYRKTHAALPGKPELRQLFDRSFVERVSDWDGVIKSYLRLRRDRDAASVAAWRKQSHALLRSKGYERALIEAMLLSVETYGDFLEKYAYLF